MDLLEYLRTFRRRWPVIAACVVVATMAAWFTSQTITPAPSSADHPFEATTRLAGNVSVGGVPLNTDALAVVATIPQVAKGAARTLRFKGDPLHLLQRVQATSDATTGFLTITATAPKLQTAEKTANAFAGALIRYLRSGSQRDYDARIAALQRKIKATADLALAQTYQTQLSLLLTEAESPVGLKVVHRAIVEEVASTGFAVSDSRLVRLLIAAVIGLLAGAGLALILERLDTKVRTSDQATERFGYPVLAEIPSIPKKQRKGVVTADHPTSRIADAFRLLGAGVHVAVRPGTEEGSPSRGRIVLVTSSGPAEGKSTVVANLAAALAEEGSKVIVFSADLRRPTLHEVLGADRKPGLVQAARETSAGPYHPDAKSGIRRYKQTTRLTRVLFVPSGGAAERPGEVLASQGVLDLLREACTAADWVVIDTAPILVAGESAPLIDEADLVLIVARSGSVSIPIAERTRDTLHRLGVDAAWVVLNDARESGLPTAYRRYHDSSERDPEKHARTTEGFPR
jgi:Mrp family chromosome partitioning ATPase